MDSVDKELIDYLWNKARKVEGLNPDLFRKDVCGALIMRDKYGKQNSFGWEIDHIFPQERGGGDEWINLRALHYLNNRSKADDYPSYTAHIRFDGSANVHDEKNLTVNKAIRDKLKAIYKNA